jgi:cytochrome c oxidase subunit 4
MAKDEDKKDDVKDDADTAEREEAKAEAKGEEAEAKDEKSGDEPEAKDEKSGDEPEAKDEKSGDEPEAKDEKSEDDDSESGDDEEDEASTGSRDEDEDADEEEVAAASGPASGHVAAAAAHAGHGHDELAHITPVSLLFKVWGALMVFTFLTVGASYIDFGGQTNLVVAMLIATVKASLVVVFFMHLRWDRRFHALTFLSGFLFVILFIGLALTDRAEYRPMVKAYQDAQANQHGGLRLGPQP